MSEVHRTKAQRVLSSSAAAALTALALSASPAMAAGKETLLVTIAGDAATLDPHVQWDTDSYTVYRNIFDNLVTRNAKGEIDIQGTMQVITSTIESWVRDYPEQWLWLHRRWR